jgi:hypothetical protein
VEAHLEARATYLASVPAAHCDAAGDTDEIAAARADRDRRRARGSLTRDRKSERDQRRRDGRPDPRAD